MLNAILSLFRMILLLLGGYEQIALENLALREQLAIFQRSVRHPKIRLMVSCAKMKSDLMWSEIVLTPQSFPICIRAEDRQVLESPKRDGASECNAA